MELVIQKFTKQILLAQTLFTLAYRESWIAFIVGYAAYHLDYHYIDHVGLITYRLK